MLGDAVLKVDPEITSQSLEIVIATMKELAVIPVATGVLRSELLDMKQKRDEQFRTFSARVRGKFETCGFMTSSLCRCGQSNTVDYTDYIIRDVLIVGIYDADIRRDIMGVVGIIDKPVNEVISLVEKREMAREANMVSGNTSAISSHRQEARKSYDSSRRCILANHHPVLPTGIDASSALNAESNLLPILKVHQVAILNPMHCASIASVLVNDSGAAKRRMELPQQLCPA